jgi:hypothetical protein
VEIQQGIAQAPDVATAQAQKADFLATLQANAQELASGGLNVTELPNFADGATMGVLSTSIEGIALNGSAIGVLKGTFFFGFSDVVKGGPAPSAVAVQSEATSLLGQVPERNRMVIGVRKIICGRHQGGDAGGGAASAWRVKIYQLATRLSGNMISALAAGRGASVLFEILQWLTCSLRNL